MIDYIYLILILILIGFILFIIYLSYEYRVQEGFMNLPPLNNNLKLDDTITELANLGIIYNNKYTSSTNDAITALTNKDYMKQADILNNSENNLLNAKKLIDLKNKLNNSVVSPDSFPIDKLISTIKSKYNSQYLSTFANDSQTYGVLANDKCMTVNGLCKEDFCLLDCQNNMYASDSQKFTTKRIYSDVDAAKVMNVPINSISTTNVYPFNIFTSIVNNKCLAINNDGLTIERCNLNNIKQQWEISPTENICLIE